MLFCVEYLSFADWFFPFVPFQPPLHGPCDSLSLVNRSSSFTGQRGANVATYITLECMKDFEVNTSDECLSHYTFTALSKSSCTELMQMVSTLQKLQNLPSNNLRSIQYT